MTINLCSCLYSISWQLNVFSNYKRDSENFKIKDFLFTYFYILTSLILIIVYGIYYFGNDTMTWVCELSINNSCEEHYFKGGGACCVFMKDNISHKVIHFMSITGGIISSLLLIVMFILNVSKIIDRKLSESNLLSNRPNIENASVTEINSNNQNTSENNENNFTLSEINKMDSDIDNCLNSINSRPHIEDCSVKEI